MLFCNINFIDALQVSVVGTQCIWCGVQLILSRFRTVLNTILSDGVTTMECLIFILALVYAIVFFVGSVFCFRVSEYVHEQAF